MLRVTWAPAPTPFRLLARLPPPQSASLCTRQNADAFNQSLSFNTSSVTSMRYMFWVRLRACPCHPLTSRPTLHVT